VLHKPLGDDPRHDLGGVVLPLAAVEAQRKGIASETEAGWPKPLAGSVHDSPPARSAGTPNDLNQLSVNFPAPAAETLRAVQFCGH
jgi:hypothetical protein